MSDYCLCAPFVVGVIFCAHTRYVCIKAGYSGVHAAQMSQTIDISAGEGKTMPNNDNISGIGFAGDKLIIPGSYRCSSIGIGNPEETIVGRGNRLASTSKGWSKAYVTKYLADNGISAKWFNCVGLDRKSTRLNSSH